MLPQLLLHRRDQGYIGGDLNCIIENRDCSSNASAKLSPSLGRLVKAMNMSDCYRVLHPAGTAYSRYYTVGGVAGYTRIDRCYKWGDVAVTGAKYEPVAFSDHMAHIVTFTLPAPLSRLLSPKSRPIFKIRPEVIRDKVFKTRLSEAMVEWRSVRDLGVEVLRLWEFMVKPGIRVLVLQRGKELSRERRGALGLLFLQQSYFARKLHAGDLHHLAALRSVQVRIEAWYEEESSKVILQAKSDDCSYSEKVRIYHHELHQKLVKKSAILKLETERGVLLGHSECAKYLEDKVSEILLTPNPLDQAARDTLLAEVPAVFTDRDNEMLLTMPSPGEVKEVLADSHLLAAPGTDGIPSLLYSECWEVVGEALVEMVQAIFAGGKPTISQRTALMVFGSKPKKLASLKPGDKRRISLLNSDFKLVTWVEARRFHSTATHTLSPLQLVAGSDRRIHHGICRARDAIQAVAGTRQGCGLLDADFQAGFDFLEMGWPYAVMIRKGCAEGVVKRIENLYSDSVTICVVNNVMGREIKNDRTSLRQGDIPSMYWFSVGLDPLLYMLDRLLAGILIISIPAAGPSPQPPPPISIVRRGRPRAPHLGPYRSRAVSSASQPPARPPAALQTLGQSSQPAVLGQPGAEDTAVLLEERYKLYAYADDLKCSISNMAEFSVVIDGCSLLERASGVRLHRDVNTGKVRFLALGR